MVGDNEDVIKLYTAVKDWESRNYRSVNEDDPPHPKELTLTEYLEKVGLMFVFKSDITP